MSESQESFTTQPNLISTLSQRISKGVVSVRENKSFIFLFHVSREPSERERRIDKYRNCRMKALLLHFIVPLSSITSSVPPNSHFDTKKGSNHGKYSPAAAAAAANHVPFLSLPTTVLPSWLFSLSSAGILYQRLLIDEMDCTQNKCVQWERKLAFLIYFT